MAGGGHTKGNPFLQAAIVALLVAAMVVLYRFTGAETPDAGIAALLAFGFVVLASFTIGRFVDVVRLPHITGYLLAGLVFGPSVAHVVGDALLHSGTGWFLPPPLDRGILFHSSEEREGTIEALSVLDTLAVALIAMTAGGELKIEGLKKGLRAITGVLAGQTIALMVLVTGGFALTAGPFFSSLGLDAPDLGTSVALGLVIASISVATSPAATIAVVNENAADGPMTRTVLSSVVLKDVVVVIAYALASVVAAARLGLSAGEDLGSYLLVHIGGSLVLGAGLGGLIALYLRWVGREILLVIVGVVYGATLLAMERGLDPVLLFIAAGFTVSNFSKAGDTLIHNVEQLSTPVYVVFFTLAGAKLHLDEVWRVSYFAIGLVVLRAFAIWIGVRVGGRLGRADMATRRHGWLGFLSQAGVAISLASLTGDRMGETGRALQTLLIAGVAINELVGPVLLQRALRAAGEVGKKGTEAAAEIPETAPSQEAAPTPSPVHSWPPPTEAEPWGPLPQFRGEDLTREFGDLRAHLEALVGGAAKGPIRRIHLENESFLREFRREFLRVQRRLTVTLRSDAEIDDLVRLLHTEQLALSNQWRDLVLKRAEVVARGEWRPVHLVETLDAIVEATPEWVAAKYEERSFATAPEEGFYRALRRTALRVRRWFSQIFRRDLVRRVPFRALARYHLSGAAPVRLEHLAALLVRSDLHMLARANDLVAAVLSGYERAASEATGRVELAGRLRALRGETERALEKMQGEASHIAKTQSLRLIGVLTDCMQDLGLDLEVAGTLDLAGRKRRSSRVFHGRLQAITILSDRLQAVRRGVGGSYRMLAMQLELRGLEAQMRDLLAEHSTAVARTVRGRAHVQADRVNQSLTAALAAIDTELAETDRTGEALAANLRKVTEPLQKVTDEATEAAGQLQEQLADEDILAPLFDALRRAALPLSEAYEVPESKIVMEDGDRLAEPPPMVEVPFRDLVSGHFEGTVAPDLAQATRDTASLVRPFVNSLQELDRLVDFKLELAAAELDAVLDESVNAETKGVLREMLVAGFERNREMAEQHVEQTSSWADDLDTALRTAAVGGLVQLREQLIAGEISKLRIDGMKRRAVGRRLIRQAEDLRSLTRARTAVSRVGRALIGEERLEAWWRVLGLPTPEIGDLSAADFAPPETKTELPLVYRRLFAADALDLRAARESEIARARSALGARGNVLRTVALVGPEGVGKGALLRAVIRSRAWRNVRRISLDRPTSVETVEQWFDSSGEGQLVVLSGFHWLMSMRAGGLATLQRFVEGVVSDRGRRAWAISADALVWRCASQVVPLRDAFGEVIDVQPFSDVELESVILARHRLSSYGLNFEGSETRSPLEEFLARGAGRIRRPYESYFQALHDASGGLVREALQLWLASIEEVHDTEHFVRVGLPPRSPQAALRRLPEPVLLNLYQVARQGWSDPSAQSHLYRIDEIAAEAQLARLAHLGLLRREQDAYVIVPHLRGPLHRVLAERGWA